MKIKLSPEAQAPLRERFTALAETCIVPAVDPKTGDKAEPRIAPGSFPESYGLTAGKLRNLASLDWSGTLDLTRAEVAAIEAELAVLANADPENDTLFGDLAGLREALA